ncbi:MAG TPA: hypothetical protein VMA83_06175 [Solirubrobacteraceae bacterium]|nr:hypothetical protein [Solirubrobacteraceae bacterium]
MRSAPPAAERPVLIAGELGVRGLDRGRAERELARGLGVPCAPLAVGLAPRAIERAIRESRALVLLAARLDERALAAGATAELATRARQAGVPAFAVAGESTLSAFDARVLDLQMVLTARTAAGLRAAGRELASAI